jgi:serine/threonine protein phosphatase PrpC
VGTTDEADLVARIVTDADMREGEILPFARGEVAVYSARSPEKEGKNEDAAALILIDSEQGVLAVADGVGGQAGGESAAEIALHRLEDAVAAADLPTRTLRGAILDGVEDGNLAVRALGIGAATTLVVAEIAGATLRPYHVGDSAMLVVGQRGKVKLQTVSHSPVGYALESGLLAEEEALHHDQRHLISNMVGSAEMRIEVGSPIRLAPRDTVLLATDGLLDNLTLQEIIEAIRAGPSASAVRNLARTCQRRMREPEEGHPSKPDDVTFVLFRLACG